MTAKTVAVIGGGPAGLMAAETLAKAGVGVVLHEAMPSLGRKFLMAGRGGLNLTHSEPADRFAARYGGARDWLEPSLVAFDPAALRTWAEDLGQPTFVGASGRVFPVAMKASPLLRAWIGRLAALGVDIRLRSRWTGWNAAGALTFADGYVSSPDAVLLALGGASWPRLGSTGAWAAPLSEAGVRLQPFQPANVGFDVAWTDLFRTRFEGQPLKGVSLSFAGGTARGDAIVSRYGIEGGPIYALSAALREAIAAEGVARLLVDLRPDLSEGRLAERLSRPRGGQSMSNHLRRTARLSPLEIGLLREAHGLALPESPRALAAAIKAAPLALRAAQPLARAISSAGGVALSEVDAQLMLKALPGVFVAGEMLDWEAPTGGYLLQASFATGLSAARGVLAWLEVRPPSAAPA